MACLRAQLADSAKLGASRDIKACGVPDDVTVAPTPEACAGTDPAVDAAVTTDDTDEAFTAPRLATLAATLLCVAAARRGAEASSAAPRRTYALSKLDLSYENCR